MEIVKLGTLGSASSLLAATLHQENDDINHKVWNIAIVSTLNSTHFLFLSTYNYSLSIIDMQKRKKKKDAKIVEI